MMSFRTGLIKLNVLTLFYELNISLRAFFCLKLIVDDSLCTLCKHVVMLFYISFFGEEGFLKNVIKSSAAGRYMGGDRWVKMLNFSVTYLLNYPPQKIGFGA